MEAAVPRDLDGGEGGEARVLRIQATGLICMHPNIIARDSWLRRDYGPCRPGRLKPLHVLRWAWMRRDGTGRVGFVQSAELVLTLVPVLAAGGAGISATLRTPGPRATSGLQHFAAGVVIAAAALELLPDVVRESGLVAIVGFAAGIAVMFGMRALTGRLEKGTGALQTSGLPWGMIGATAVDFFIDGLILGAGFTAGGHTGVLLSIALAIEYLFVGLSLAGALGTEARSAVVIAVPVLLSLLTVAGTFLGLWLLAGATPVVLAAVLAFGAVAFMYLATEELLVEAHAQGETAIGSSAFYIGFLSVLMIEQALR